MSVVRPSIRLGSHGNKQGAPQNCVGNTSYRLGLALGGDSGFRVEKIFDELLPQSRSVANLCVAEV